MDDRTTGAAAMKRLRKSRGLSLADTARALLAIADDLGQPRGSLPSVAGLQRSVARWESAAPTRPDERHQLLLAHLYARTLAGALSIGAGSDFAELLDALGHLGESEHRLAELRTLLLRTATEQGGGLLALLSPATQAGLAAAVADPSRVDEPVVAGLAAAVADVNAQVGSLPFVRLQLLLAPVVEACRQLLGGPVPEPVLPSLRVAAVAARTLAGRLAFETRDDAASRALYAEATREAGLLADPWRRATVHMSHALVTLYSTQGLEDARRLVDAAVRDARTGGSVTVRARAHALQAEIAARANEQRQAQAALGLAWYDMDSGADGDPSTSSFSPGHLAGFEGVCELYVGDPAVAHDRFARSAASLVGPREQVQRAIVTTDQALARVRMGEPQAAAELLHGCVTAAAATGGRVPAIRLKRARRELRPWRREDWVADLDDHLMDVLGA
jgi:transcriptional regulator with XRE-family HTH domain